jgi:thiamine biosynthesis lipoprotein
VAAHDVSRLRVGLGTFVAVTARAERAAEAERGIAAAYEAIAQVERLMHPTRAGSDLRALQMQTPGRASSVHPWTWSVLELCRRLNRASAGVFDPCVPESEATMADLELRDADQVVAHAPLSIDLGGIAKGFAVDRALEALRAAGCHGGLVNAGGDLAVFGPCGRDIVYRLPGGAALIELKDAAMASSAVGGDARPPEHRGHYSGASRRAITSGCACVVAPCAAVADGLTKCLLAGGAAIGGLLQAFEAHRIDC